MRSICVVDPDFAKWSFIMLGWALAFLLLAVVAGVLGFGGIAGVSAWIAQILFVVFLALLVLSFVVRALRGRGVS
jgi:uncharacterized membrane protein YtjA (UPF0391 family)